jgi:hypothetical protein
LKAGGGLALYSFKNDAHEADQSTNPNTQIYSTTHYFRTAPFLNVGVIREIGPNVEVEVDGDYVIDSGGFGYNAFSFGGFGLRTAVTFRL